MILAIVGSRSIENYSLFCDIMTKVEDPIEKIISGGALGVDHMAEVWAYQNHISMEIIRPDWKKYGKYAGFKRNREIIEKCDKALIIWDGTSRGTLNDIQICQEINKPYILHSIALQYLPYYPKSPINKL